MEIFSSKKIIFIIFILFILQIHILPVYAQNKLRVGVLEFEQKNNIGLENSEKIIPEILVTHLKNIGKYRLTERILLKKALKEQELQMTGIVSSRTAVRVGKIYGIQAFITGSAVKIGKNISISGRVINTENANIIASGTIKFNNIEDIEMHLESLAYQLSGYSKDDFRRIGVERELSKSRYGTRVGLGYATNNGQTGPNSSYKEYMIGIFYHSQYFDIELMGTPPPSDVSGATAFISINPFVHFGFTGGLTLMHDAIADDNNPTNDTRVEADSKSVLYGFTFRATASLRATVLFGTPLSGEFIKEDPSGNYVYNIKNEFRFPSSIYMINIEYYINDTLSVMLTVWGGGGTAEPDRDKGNMSTQDMVLESQVFFLSCGYSFSL